MLGSRTSGDNAGKWKKRETSGKNVNNKIEQNFCGARGKGDQSRELLAGANEVVASSWGKLIVVVYLKV